LKLRDIGEFGWIDRIRHGCLIRTDGIVKGIGDDAAVFFTADREAVLVTTDLLVERIHFIRNAGTAFDLGYKALAVNLSDIAAMGGLPREAFVSIGIPEACSIAYLDALYDGMKQLAAEHAVNLLGGDTTGSQTDLILNITVVGAAPPSEILYRHTALPGDILLSTGFLGDSRAGLHLLLEKIPADAPFLQDLLNAHLKPKPHVREGRFLASRKGIHAAIDVSDGLSSDLGHILKESRVGACLDADRIPISENLKRFCKRFSRNPLEYALSGGEDYTLLVTADPDAADAIRSAYEKIFNAPLYSIGRITDSGKLELREVSGGLSEVSASGWDHFR